MRANRFASGRAVVVAAFAFGLAACTIESTVVANTTSQLVVHAVLDPGAAVQEVLVERTLTGTLTIDDRVRYDSLDPINTGGGIPVAGATVVITGPDGPLSGIEIRYPTKTNPSYGAGRYLVQAGVGIGKKPIRPGGIYALSVRSTDGGVVTGTTVVPNATPVSVTTRIDAFNREADTVRLAWPKVPFARLYGLRVESPFNAYLMFTDSIRQNLPGSVHNVFAADFQRLFIPGFTQITTVYAVDTNYFEYYRLGNDPFTGSGLINHLKGGIGLFGSAVTIDSRVVDVTQPMRDPSLEGTWQVVAQGTARPTVSSYRLYIESSTATSASLSGSYVKDVSSTAREGFAGARDGSRIELQFLNNQDIHQTYARFIGTLMADSIVGAYTNTSVRSVFRKKS